MNPTLAHIIDAACKVSGVTANELACASKQSRIGDVRAIIAALALRAGYSHQAIASAMGRNLRARWPAPRNAVMLRDVEKLLAVPTPLRPILVTYAMSPSEMLHLLEVSDEHRKAAAQWVADRLRLRYDPTTFQRSEVTP